MNTYGKPPARLSSNNILNHEMVPFFGRFNDHDHDDDAGHDDDDETMRL